MKELRRRHVKLRMRNQQAGHVSSPTSEPIGEIMRDYDRMQAETQRILDLVRNDFGTARR